MMVEPGNTTLGRMLLDEITPLVMVLSTPLVEDSCRKNGRSLVELLTPFCNFNNIDVPVRTASDQPYRVRRFKLRLFYASELRQRNIEVTKERLKQVITEASDREVYELCSDPPEIKSVIETSEQAAEPSWFQTFNRELVNTASFSEHEAFDHPVACLVVVSSKDKDPINKFFDLFNTNQLPSLLNDGSMDPKILKYFLLVHDNQDGLLENSTGILTKLRSAFGSNDCRLLYINSSADGAEEQQDSPWASYENGVSHDQRSAAFLNADDIDELRSTMQDIASKHIIPHMEMKIRLLNQQVSATRRGIKNQFKNLLWRKGKDDAPENPSGPMYTFSSIESQIRVLGDYAFMLRDYELALSNYRLISTDYKLDKAWKRYAGVQEMMGLAYFMLDHSRKDAEYCMENAFSTYLKIGSAGARNATRCGLWWAEMLKARDQYKDAAGVFFRISGEEPLHSAVMIEQASYCYLLSTPTMSRKYGFHLVLSGELYSKCDQIKHAIRTYRVALSVFKGTSWSRIRDHVHFHIGKWYALLGMFDKAIQHMVEVLSCGHQSRLTQELFLKDLFKTIQESGKSFEVLRLQLPVISLPSITVVFEDHRTYASPAAASVRESLWRSLEAEMFQSVSVMKTNWLDSQPTVLPKKYKDSNICVAGEAIKVDLGFRNPLQIPISITNVSLICEHSVDPDETGSDVSGSLIDHHNTEELKIVSVSGDFNLDTSLFALSEVDISMQGGESTLVQLTVTPKIEGILKVVGIRWKLKGSVVGVRNFNAEVRKKAVRGKRKLKQPTDNKLEFLVIKTLPRLEGVIKDFPKAVYAGDLRRLILELKNPSKISVKNLKMRVSHPRFLSVADLEAMNSEFPTCLRNQGDGPHSCNPSNSSEASNNVFVFPETTSVSADVPLVWPLWFRAAYSGNITLCITIYYEMEDRSATITHRTLRMVYNLEVLPCLETLFQISPCLFRGKEFLVQMDVINRTSSETFRIHQISCLREQWELALLNNVDYVDPLGLVSAGQALSYFFKLKKCRKQANAEDNTFSSVIALGSADVILADSDSTGLFDVSVPPLMLFHHHEQLIQERVEQDDQNTVDFILMSESQRNSDSGLQRSSEVYCHYKCHCSVASTSPISWLLNSPRTIKHDFSSGFCEVPLTITVHNSSKSILSLHLKTFDSTPPVHNSDSSNSLVAETEVGWHDLSHLTELKVTTDASKPVVRKAWPATVEASSSFIWSGSSSTRLKIDPLTSGEIPLLICMFSPGTFDISNYVLQWDVLPSTEEGDSVSSGTCQGYSYHITVLQTD